MSITVVTGQPGSGKTLFLAMRAWRHRSLGLNVFANYSLRFPHRQANSLMLAKWAKGEAQLRDCVLSLTELQILMDARRSSSSRNLMSSYLVLQTRKRRVHLMGDTQHLRQVDLRIRDNLDYLVEAEWLNPWEPDPMQFVFNYEVFDRWRGAWLHPITIRGADYYGLYDTSEPILDFSLPSQEKPRAYRPRTKGLQAEKEKGVKTWNRKSH